GEGLADPRPWPIDTPPRSPLPWAEPKSISTALPDATKTPWTPGELSSEARQQYPSTSRPIITSRTSNRPETSGSSRDGRETGDINRPPAHSVAPFDGVANNHEGDPRTDPVQELGAEKDGLARHWPLVSLAGFIAVMGILVFRTVKFWKNP
ncbi:MAG: hypothetical protein HW403_956, partial [Dehalococcoidia bacterium]|nr:hypothetical protein [Dehalococcoidia bacterium]